MQAAVFFYNSSLTLSYNNDWVDAFLGLEDSGFNVTAYNIREISLLKWMKVLRGCELLVFLHSTNSNATALSLMQIKSLLLRKGKTVFFIGNEYKLMPEKIMLLKNTGADVVVSQLPQDISEWLYSDLGAKVISLPHALNPNAFSPVKKYTERAIDIGSRFAEYPWYLGDNCRNELLELLGHFQGKGFIVDVSQDYAQRFDRKGWADFLNNCRFTVSTEAGSSFLERDDRTRKVVNKYVNENPDKTFNDIYEKFFKEYKNPVSGKCISPRHFDAIGTKTCQILLEGRYNDILKPDEHYIELKKNYSNINEIMEKMRDYNLVSEMTDRAYEYVSGNHTHKHRIQYLFSKII